MVTLSRDNRYYGRFFQGVELHRSDYDLKGAVAGFSALGYPGVEDFEEALVEPPDPAWVADYFEQQAADRG